MMITGKKKLASFLFAMLLVTGCGAGYGVYHHVKPGETLQSISSAYGVNKKELLRRNYLDKNYNAKTGDAIWIPGAGRVVSAKASRSSYKNSPPSKKGVNKSKKHYVKKRSNSKPSNVDIDFLWPLKGKIYSKFGSLNGETHDGIDISAEIGDKIKASASGRVIYSGNAIKGYGNMVIIKHEGTCSTVYAHNSKNKVAKGDFVTKGDVIALAGQSGRIDVPALHFEIRTGKEAIDPVHYLP
jgi:lipoprotein NlpD